MSASLESVAKELAEVKRLVERLADASYSRPASPLMSRSEAMGLLCCKSATTFARRCAELGLKPVRRGLYSREVVNRALLRSLRGVAA